MNFSYVYLVISIFISIMVGLLVYFYIPLYEIKGIGKALEGVLLLSSISLGFYGACLSVFASIFNTKVVKELMNDKEYRREFIMVAGCSLSSGFFTVFITIVYQVMLENKLKVANYLGIVNSLWAGITVLFLALNILFVLISFLIFFSNTDQKTSKEVHNGEIGMRDVE